MLSWLPLHAQGAIGSVTGLVRDPAGLGVPNAVLLLKNNDTATELRTVANETGSFNFASVKIGDYQLEVEAPGFRRLVAESVRVETAAATRLNLSMELGSTVEAVTVSAELPLLQRENSSSSTVVNRSLLDNVPYQLTGTNRDVLRAISFAPGVYGNAGNFNLNITGGRQHATEVLVDGVTNNYRGAFGSPFSVRPSYTSVSEFRVETAVPPAEYGRTSSGVVIMTTKSGTNAFHGNIDFLLRNNVLDARRFNARSADVTRQGEGSVSVGGPVLFPKLYDGRNRTFFFTDITVFRRINEPQGVVRTVGTLGQRGGDFADVAQSIFDPLSDAVAAQRTPFAANRIPNARISDFGRAMLEVIPNPNLPTAAGNLVGSQRNLEKMTVFLMKIDHIFSEAHRVTLIGRPSWNVRDNFNGPWGPSRLEGFFDKPYAPHINMSHDWILSPTLLNHVQVGYTNWFSLFLQTPGIRYQVPGSFGPGFPALRFQGQGLSSIGENVDRTVGSNLINIQDSVSFTTGKHNLKFGFRFDWLEDNTEILGNRNGTYTFSPVTTSRPGTAGSGHAFASMLLGAPNTAAMQFGFPLLARSQYYAFYAQDDWKVSSRLTLNYGMRFEIQRPWQDRDGNTSNLDLNTPNSAAGNLPGALVFGGEGNGRTGSKQFVNNYFRAFGPRLGLAYQLTSSTVLRAGAGIFYPPRVGANVITEGFSSNPSVSSLDGGLNPAFYLDAGWPAQVAVQPPFIDPTRGNGREVSFLNSDAQRGSGRLSRTYQMQVGLQQRLGQGVVDVGWVSTQARHIPGNILDNLNQVDPRFLELGSLLTQNINSAAVRAAGFAPPFPGFNGTLAQSLRPYPQFQNINYIDAPTGSSSYHGLLAKFEQRFSSGLAVLASYTFSKNITDTAAPMQDAFNRRPQRTLAAIDVPHRMVTSIAYDLPFGKGKRFLNTGLASHLLGGFSLGGTLLYESGVPLRITIPNTLPLFGRDLRPVLAPGQAPVLITDHSAFRPFNSLSGDRGDAMLNRSAFALPAPFTFGNLAPFLGAARAFGSANEDISLMKRQYLGEGQFLEFRTDWFNAFNRSRLNAPITDLTSPNFGLITGQQPARVIQLGVRYNF
ncbi:MAG: carboxypeptidase regulatory-like domain-containing protein [Bryobacterales bacterium]|nr:carboxypeptidase regulatory-like domain-containing protein [Bryobacterales bacterium]